jgi:hypothetical protein
VVSACATPSAPGLASSAAPSRLQRILKRGELRVGTSADLPPLNIRNKQGEVAGLEIDLVGALADAMKLELHFVVVSFGDLLPTPERGEVDLVISGMTMTPKRNARVAFAPPPHGGRRQEQRRPHAVAGRHAHLKTLYENVPTFGDADDVDPKPHAYYILAGSASVILAVAPECRRPSGLDPATAEAVHVSIVSWLLVP